jgi:hypothetical protein
MRNINAIFRSEFFGAGKTWTAISFVNPTKGKPKRLIYDPEYRSDNYRSTDGEDHPERGMFAFEDWRSAYGEDFTAGMLKMIEDVRSGDFDYNVMIFDNASLFQTDLDIVCREKSTAQDFCDVLGITPKHQNFLKYRWNPNDAGSYYFLIKSIIGGILVEFRRHNVDVMVTSESKNVWHNYGKRDGKILGQTAKLWDPWFQYADLLLVLERIKGDRNDGTAQLTPWPTAKLDTFSPKSSIPGIAPEFVFKDWSVFWKMVQKRRVPNEGDFAKIDIQQAITPESSGFQTIAEAKTAIVNYAIEVGYIEREGQAAKAIPELGNKYGLDTDNVLAEYLDWLAAIEEEINEA